MNDGAEPPAVRRRNALVLGAAGALTCLPVFADLLFSFRHAPFRYFTSDTYYYLNVARNVAQKGLVSFDGERPTNGFHPLWQAILALLYKTCLLLGVSELSFCYLAVLLGACLATLAVVLLGRTIVRVRGALPLSFALLPVGLYALLVAPLFLYTQVVLRNVSAAEGPFPLYGTVWSYVNGMESSLALLAYAVFAHAVVTRAAAGAGATARSAAILGLAGACVVLARLDQVFLAGAVLAFLAGRWIASGRGSARNRVLALGAGFALPIGLYLLANLAYAGVAMPVSGASKLSLAHPGRASLESLGIVLASSARSAFWLDRVFRLAQLLLPFAAAAGTLIVLRRRGPLRDELDGFLAATAAGVLALTGTIFLFASAQAYGSWSLPVPVLFVSLAVLVLPRERKPAGARAAFLLLAGAAPAVLAVFFALHRQTDYHERYRLFYMRRNAVLAAYEGRAPRIIENDDGIVGFATGFQTLSAFNFATDRELFAAIREGRLLSVARDRGYDRLASLVYLPLEGDRTGAAALAALARSHRGDGVVASYALEYYDPSLPFAIVKIAFRPPPRQSREPHP